MARSKAELQKLMAELEEEMNSATEEPEEIWVRTPDGYEVKLTGEKASRFLARHKKQWEEDLEEATPIPKKRTPAKKNASVKKAVESAEENLEEIEEDLEEVLDEDPQPNKQRSFWG